MMARSVLLFLVLAAVSAYGQAVEEPSRVEIIDADRLEGEKLENEYLRTLVGNAKLRQDSTLIFANRAVQFETARKVVLTGRVRIIEGTDSLRARRVDYDEATKTGVGRGDVELTDGEYTLRAPRGSYDTNSKDAFFYDDVTMEDETSTLTSLEGTYNSRTKLAIFYGTVRLEQESMILEADTMRHDRNEDVTEASGSILGHQIEEPDSTSNEFSESFLFGASMWRTETTDSSVVSGDALLARFTYESSETDTLLVAAPQLISVESDTLDRLYGRGGVRMWSPSFAATAVNSEYVKLIVEATVLDSIGQEESVESIVLQGSPVMWFDETQITGDSMHVSIRNGSIDSLEVFGNVFTASLDSATTRINQLKGTQMVARFQRDTLRFMQMRTNAEAIYHRAVEDSNAVKEIIQVSADRIVFNFGADGEISEVGVYQNLEGQLYSKDAIPAEELRLSGFQWSPERKPGPLEMLPPNRAARLDKPIEQIDQ